MLFNKGRVNEYLKRYNLEAIVATTPVNVTYFTGLDCWAYREYRESMMVPGASDTLLQSYAVVTADRDPTLVIGTGLVQFAEELTDIEILTYGGIDAGVPRTGKMSRGELILRKAASKASTTPQEILVKAIQDAGVKKGRVGIEFGNLTHASKNLIEKRLNHIEWLDSTELLRMIRMVKTREEVDRMQTAATIIDAGMRKVAETARTGAVAGDLLHTFNLEVTRQNAKPTIFVYSPKGLGVSNLENHKFDDDDYTLIDGNIVYKSYYADTGWTLVFGRGNTEATRMHTTLCEIFESCLDSVKLGATPSSVLDAFRKAYEKKGIKGVGYHGHSIGLEPREHPAINYSNFRKIEDDIVRVGVDIPLEEGMVINLETPLEIRGKGAFQVERTFLIRGKGLTELTPKRDGMPYFVQ